MPSPFRKPKPRFSTQRLTSLLLWALIGVMLARAFSWAASELAHWLGDGAKFRAAFEAVAQLEANPNAAGWPADQTRYGIPQTEYDRWRRQQGEQPQAIAQISESEAEAIYRLAWDEASCGDYRPPLDVACLDSVVGFGLTDGTRFLAQLPSDPKQAAIEVAERREAYRQQLAESQIQRSSRPAPYGGYAPPYAPPPYARPNYPQRGFPGSAYARPNPQPNPQVERIEQWVETGTSRDRALAAYAGTYAASGLSLDIAKWLGFGSSESSRPTPEPIAANSPQPLTSDQLYAQAKQFTVEVWLTDPTTGRTAPGSGIILTPDGLILTNYHVVKAGTLDGVKVVSGKDYTGDVIDSDRDLDLALIQLQQAKDLPTAPLAADSTHIQIGDTVYAIGSPEGEHWKLTTAQVIDIESQCGLQAVRCIRTPSGVLRPGNSGGPLLDRTGRVVGINRAIQGRTGEGVSIPIEMVKRFIDRAGGLRR